MAAATGPAPTLGLPRLRARRLRRLEARGQRPAGGLDFEPFPFFDSDGGENYTPAAVQAALAAGRTSQALVDRAVRRLLRTLFAYGFFDRAAYADDDSRDRPAPVTRRTRGASRRPGPCCSRTTAALPLDAARLKSLAVIGADGDAYKNGGGSSNVSPTRWSTPREGIATRAGVGVDVRYDPGDDPERAADVARGADAAVVVVADTAGRASTSPASRSTAAPGPAWSATS